MTTRHTISHADELYSGNAFKAGYSPDGRRGIKMTHLYAHEFKSTAGVAALAANPDGLFSSMKPSLLTATGKNLISLAQGTMVSVGSTIISFDVPRNITFSSSNTATGVYLKLEGLDQYGEPMAEAIKGAGAGAWASGKRCFKSLSKIYTTAAFTTTVSIGTGARLGLPFHLQTKAGLLGVSVDGHFCSGTTGAFTVHIGASSATTMTSSGGQPDARGAIVMLSPAPDGSKRISALMVVDHSTDRAAFGPPQVSSCSNSV